MFSSRASRMAAMMHAPITIVLVNRPASSALLPWECLPLKTFCSL